MGGHVARMGETSHVYRLVVGKPEGRKHWEDQDVDWWIILRWVLERSNGWCGLDCSCSG
jgi:hypothetical protein